MSAPRFSLTAKASTSIVFAVNRRQKLARRSRCSKVVGVVADSIGELTSPKSAQARFVSSTGSIGKGSFFQGQPRRTNHSLSTSLGPFRGLVAPSPAERPAIGYRDHSAPRANTAEFHRVGRQRIKAATSGRLDPPHRELNAELSTVLPSGYPTSDSHSCKLQHDTETPPTVCDGVRRLTACILPLNRRLFMDRFGQPQNIQCALWSPSSGYSLGL